MNKREIEFQLECIKDHTYKITTLYKSDSVGIKLQVEGIDSHIRTILEELKDE